MEDHKVFFISLQEYFTGYGVRNMLKMVKPACPPEILTELFTNIEK